VKGLLKKMHGVGLRGVADIVINHRCGDKQDSQGRWNVFTSTGIEHRNSFAGVMDWQLNFLNPELIPMQTLQTP
jgi:hypothetical protein